MDTVCDQCNRKFKGQKYLDQHMKKKTSCTAIYVCSKCETKFRSQRDLSRHENRKTSCESTTISIITDTTDINTNCMFCNKKYSTKSSLNRHLLSCNKDNTAAMKEEIAALKKQVFKMQQHINELTGNTENIYIKHDPAFDISIEEHEENPKDCVYFIQQIREASRIKIGVSNCCINRKNALQTANSDELEIIGIIETPNHYELESKFHKSLKDYRIRGEWFELSEEEAITMLDNYRNTGDISN